MDPIREIFGIEVIKKEKIQNTNDGTVVTLNEPMDTFRESFNSDLLRFSIEVNNGLYSDLVNYNNVSLIYNAGELINLVDMDSNITAIVSNPTTQILNTVDKTCYSQNTIEITEDMLIKAIDALTRGAYSASSSTTYTVGLNASTIDNLDSNTPKIM
ncbi:MAG: hypothetical protein Q9M91_00245 [Candidatus Dojkabacteria bacterium]|nr:hypothetical protein [Candidatus Dojkabacteria bacterium]